MGWDPELPIGKWGVQINTLEGLKRGGGHTSSSTCRKKSATVNGFSVVFATSVSFGVLEAIVLC